MRNDFVNSLRTHETDVDRLNSPVIGYARQWSTK